MSLCDSSYELWIMSYESLRLKLWIMSYELRDPPRPSIVFVPPPLCFSPVSRGRATLWGREKATVLCFLLFNIEHSTLNIQHSNAVYNLSGQKLSAPQKGINIINGKKVVYWTPPRPIEITKAAQKIEELSLSLNIFLGFCFPISPKSITFAAS